MKYHLTYKVETHPEGLDKKDIDPNERGACTAIVLGSLLYPPDGGCSTAFLTLDRRTGKPLSDDELFKVWAMLAARLKDSSELGPGRRAVATVAFESVRQAILAARGIADNGGEKPS